MKFFQPAILEQYISWVTARMVNYNRLSYKAYWQKSTETLEKAQGPRILRKTLPPRTLKRTLSQKSLGRNLSLWILERTLSLRTLERTLSLRTLKSNASARTLKTTLSMNTLEKTLPLRNLNRTLSLRTLQRTLSSAKTVTFQYWYMIQQVMWIIFFTTTKVFEVLVFILQSLEIYHSVYATANVHAIYVIYTKIVKGYNYFCKTLHL